MSEEDKFRPVVGIDLGTTNSLLAIIRNGVPEVVPIDGQVLLPSVVHRAPDGSILVGEDAKAALIAMPDRSVASIKRLMGTDKLVRMAGEEFTPVEISAMILKRLKQATDEVYGEGPKEAVITVPAYFNDRQRRDTQEAGRIAGFVVERIINEPTAAAMAFGLEHRDAQDKLVVYDLGGGTFDISVVQMEDGILEVMASDGHRALGGNDFDQLIVDAWCRELAEVSQFNAKKNLHALALLRREAELAKMQLSTQESVFVEIPVVALTGTGTPISFSTTLTRRAFDAMIEPLLRKTMDITRDTLKAADLKPEQISNVLLVGGSTRIVRVRQMIEEFFQRAPHTEVDPDRAVALGAAIQAGIKSGALGQQDFIVTDVAPFSMGIAVLKESAHGGWVPGGFAPIIVKNTTVPTTRTRSFYTVVDNQESIDVEVYQGEKEWVAQNLRLGSVTVSGLARKPAGQESIDVTFRYTLNGMLDVQARAPSTGAVATLRLNDALDRSSQERLQQSRDRISRSQAAFDFDEDTKEGEEQEIEVTASVEELLAQARQLRRRLRRVVPKTALAELDAFLSELSEAVADEDIDRLTEVTNRAYEWLLELEESRDD